MRTVTRVILYDVILGLIYISFDISLIYFYLSNGHTWWAAATVTAVALPGMLECLCYTYSYLHGDLEGTKKQQFLEWLFWVVCFGPVLYPVSLVVWHLVQICKGENNFHRFETLARSRVLNSLSVLTKSALQLTLQATIMMVTWRYDNIPWHSYQLASASLSILILAKSCTDHHYFEMSGKNVKVRTPYGQLIRRMLFNILHIIFRGFVIALLASYLQFLALAVIGLMVMANYITSHILIKTDGSKHIWTAFAAVLLPNCFVSRNTLEHQSAKDTQRLFTKFYRWNSVIFLVVIGIVALVCTNCIISLTSLSNFNCSNYPFLSYDQDLACPPSSPFTTPISSFPAPHSWFYLLGNLSVVSLSALHVFFVFVEGRVCGKDYAPVPRV